MGHKISTKVQSTLKIYGGSIVLLWGLFGMILLATEVKQIKARIETLDLKIRSGSLAPRVKEDIAMEKERTTVGEVQEIIYMVTADSLTMPEVRQNKSEKAADNNSNVGKAGDVKVSGVKEIPTGKESKDSSSEKSNQTEKGQISSVQTESSKTVTGEALPKQEAQSLAPMETLEVEEIVMHKSSKEIQVRFKLVNLDKGHDNEGHVLGRLELESDSNGTQIGVKASAFSTAIDSARSIDALAIKEFGEFYRLKYRLGKQMEFVLPQASEDSKFSLVLYFRTAQGEVKVKRISQLKMPRMAQGSIKAAL